MKVIFTGDPIEIERNEGLSRLTTSIFGVTFPMSAEVDVSHLPEKQRQKLLNNPHFRAAGIDAPAVPLVLPGAPVDPADDGAERADAGEAAPSRRKRSA